MNTINILIVDDHPMVLEGLKALISNISNVVVSGTASNAFEALDIIKKNNIDIAILDINLPEVSGIELTGRLKQEHPTVKVLAMSTFKEQSYVTKMMQNGALGYIVKSASKDEIESAIQYVSKGQIFLGTGISQSGPPGDTQKDTPLISRREKEVLQLISDGFTNPQIAEKLFISLHTADSHRKNLLTKFGVNNTASLLRIAVKCGLVTI